MKADQQRLIEVYGLWSSSANTVNKLYIFLSVILGAVLLYIIFKKIRTQRVLTPAQEALQELYRLQSQTYVSEQSLHDTYFKLTAIIKTYLAVRYKVVLQDKSDTEIVALLHGNMSENMISLLQEFFDRAFRIKFAYDVVCEQMLLDDIIFLQQIIIETSKSEQS